jgi:uncharacterized integral membrane protein
LAEAGGGRCKLVNTQGVQSNPATDGPAGPAARRGRRSPTRIGSAWLAIAVAVVLGICLIDFLAQNTESVKIEFFSVVGRMPVVVALLAAAVAGALVVLVIGVARTTQLHLGTRRHLHPKHRERITSESS